MWTWFLQVFFPGDSNPFGLLKLFAERVLEPSPATSCPQALNLLSWRRGCWEYGEAHGCSMLPFRGASLKNPSTSKPQPTMVQMPSTTWLKQLCTSARPCTYTSLLPLLPPQECRWHHTQLVEGDCGQTELPSRFSRHVDPGSCSSALPLHCLVPPWGLPAQTPLLGS